jgi:hypothetical protein
VPHGHEALGDSFQDLSNIRVHRPQGTAAV